MFVVILWATWREQNYLRKHLWPEVTAGIISQAHYRIATSGWRQMGARITSLFNGSFLRTRRFYQVCGELAHKKQQLIAVGNEQEYLPTIHKLRRELAILATDAQV